MQVKHTLKPIYNINSEILILGSIPSVKSREVGFYYAHKQNRFWKILASLWDEELPNTIPDKIDFLNRHHIALWDVLESCDINGSSDSSIKKAKANNINKILKKTNIKTIFVTGKKALDLYNKLCLPQTHIACIYLPSPSPANCAISFQDIKEAYKIILKYIKK